MSATAASYVTDPAWLSARESYLHGVPDGTAAQSYIVRVNAIWRMYEIEAACDPNEPPITDDVRERVSALLRTSGNNG